MSSNSAHSIESNYCPSGLPYEIPPGRLGNANVATGCYISISPNSKPSFNYTTARYSVVGFPEQGEPCTIADKHQPIQFNQFVGNESHRGNLMSFRATKQGPIIIDVGYAFDERALEPNFAGGIGKNQNCFQSELSVCRAKNGDSAKKSETTTSNYEICPLKFHRLLNPLPKNNVPGPEPEPKMKQKHINVAMCVNEGDIITFGFSTGDNSEQAQSRSNLVKIQLDKNKVYMKITETVCHTLDV